jgi:hypothetical protein
MHWRFKLTTAAAAIGLLALMSGTSGVRAQDYYNYNGNGYNGNNNAYAPYNYGGYGYQAPVVPYGNGGYVYQQPYPYYGNYYYGASPQYGYTYGGPILYGRFGRDGRVGYRFGWW